MLLLNVVFGLCWISATWYWRQTTWRRCISLECFIETVLWKLCRNPVKSYRIKKARMCTSCRKRFGWDWICQLEKRRWPVSAPKRCWRKRDSLQSLEFVAAGARGTSCFNAAWEEASERVFTCTYWDLIFNSSSREWDRKDRKKGIASYTSTKTYLVDQTEKPEIWSPVVAEQSWIRG